MPVRLSGVLEFMNSCAIACMNPWVLEFFVFLGIQSAWVHELTRHCLHESMSSWILEVLGYLSSWVYAPVRAWIHEFMISWTSWDSGVQYVSSCAIACMNPWVTELLEFTRIRSTYVPLLLCAHARGCLKFLESKVLESLGLGVHEFLSSRRCYKSMLLANVGICRNARYRRPGCIKLWFRVVAMPPLFLMIPLGNTQRLCNILPLQIEWSQGLVPTVV